jgi:DNA-directed RNA polymerase subunit beta'
MDHLLGLKENVIVGHLIPAGTGLREYESIYVTSKAGADQAVREGLQQEEYA